MFHERQYTLKGFLLLVFCLTQFRSSSAITAISSTPYCEISTVLDLDGAPVNFIASAFESSSHAVSQLAKVYKIGHSQAAMLVNHVYKLRADIPGCKEPEPTYAEEIEALHAESVDVTPYVITGGY